MALAARATRRWRVLASPRGSMLSDPDFDLSEPESAAAQRSARLSVLFTGLLYPSWSYLIGALGPPLSPPIKPPTPRGAPAAANSTNSLTPNGPPTQRSNCCVIK